MQKGLDMANKIEFKELTIEMNDGKTFAFASDDFSASDDEVGIGVMNLDTNHITIFPYTSIYKIGVNID